MKKEIYQGEPVRLDKYLSEVSDDLTRSYLQKQIKEGAVTVNEQIVKPSYLLSAGDVIAMELAPPTEPDILPQAIELDILYEDADILIVNKPRGMVVHPAPGHYEGTLVNALMAYCKDDLSGISGVQRPGIVHRIDKDTSGALLVCKSDAAHQAAARQLKEHSMKRVYVGIVCGHVREECGVIDAPIARHVKDRKRMAVAADGKGKAARTHYELLERLEGYDYLSFRLETGRTHQIRVHMASIHHPLLGDSLYKAPKNRYGIEGQLLHARVLGLVHPISGAWIEVEAPQPPEFDRVLQALRAR